MIETTAAKPDQSGLLARKMNKSFSTGSIFNSELAVAAAPANTRNQNLTDPVTSHSKPMAPPPPSRLAKDLSVDNFSNSSTSKTSNVRLKSLVSTTTVSSLKDDSSSAHNGLNLSSIKPRIKSQSFETSLILIHRFLKEKNVYALAPNEQNSEFKHRTVYLARNASSASSYNPSGGNEFGFNLQTYGLLNSATKLTEYICFVNNVQARSAAKRAGLTNGDILLAIDNMRIEQFKRFDDIVRHVRGKSELFLVIFPESTCKRVQYQMRVAQIERTLEEKRSLLKRLASDEQSVLRKYAHLLIDSSTTITTTAVVEDDSASPKAVASESLDATRDVYHQLKSIFFFQRTLNSINIDFWFPTLCW
jgi:hypothetical protein